MLCLIGTYSEDLKIRQEAARCLQLISCCTLGCISMYVCVLNVGVSLLAHAYSHVCIKWVSALYPTRFITARN